MLRRAAAIILLVWALGFFWFAIALPLPLGGGSSAAVAVPTGGKGRIDRGLAVLQAGQAKQLLVSGVDRDVKVHEFALQYKVPPELMVCCVALGFDAADTRGNAKEIADWLKTNGHTSVRLVTSDWHMRRAAFELSLAVPDATVVSEDAVATQPSFTMLFLEYNKYLARRVTALAGV